MDATKDLFNELALIVNGDDDGNSCGMREMWSTGGHHIEAGIVVAGWRECKGVVRRAHGVWLGEYRSLDEARESLGRYLWEHNHDRPHRGLQDRSPREGLVQLESDLRIKALRV